MCIWAAVPATVIPSWIVFGISVQDWTVVLLRLQVLQGEGCDHQAARAGRHQVAPAGLGMIGRQRERA
jgi:hypothetical protein